MRRLAPLLLVLGLLGPAACGDDDDGDPAAFCERLDRLTSNDPFAAFGDRATTAEIELAFTALVERVDELVEVAPPDARAAARDLRDATVALDELLAEAGYGTDVDPRAYREQQERYGEAATRLERYLTAIC